MRCAVSRSDPRQPERLRHRGHDRHCAVGRDGQDAVHAVLRRPTSVTAATSVKSTTSATSAAARPGASSVAVDRDDAQPPAARVLDRAALVAARADEEDRLHGRRC